MAKSHSIEKIMDDIRGYFSGIPGKVLAERRALRHALSQEDKDQSGLVEAYRTQDPQGLRALEQEQAKNKNTPLQKNLALLQRMNEATQGLKSLPKRNPSDTSIKLATEKAFELGKDGYFKAFEEITADISVATCAAKQRVFQELRSNNPNPDGPYEYYALGKSEQYAWAAAKGFSQLQETEKCQGVLFQLSHVYKNAGVDFAETIFDRSDINDPDNVTMSIAAANFFSGQENLPDETLRTILASAASDEAKMAILQGLQPLDKITNPEARTARIGLLIEHCKTTKDQPSSASKKFALEQLTGSTSYDEYNVLHRDSLTPEGEKNLQDFHTMALDELKKGSDHVIEALFGNTEAMRHFLRSYNNQQHAIQSKEPTRVKSTMVLDDLIPFDATGAEAAQAKIKLAKILLKQVIDYDRPVPEEADMTHAVARFAQGVILDRTLAEDAPEKIAAEELLADLIIEQKRHQAELKAKLEEQEAKAGQHQDYAGHESYIQSIHVTHKENIQLLSSGVQVVDLLNGMGETEAYNNVKAMIIFKENMIKTQNDIRTQGYRYQTQQSTNGFRKLENRQG